MGFFDRLKEGLKKTRDNFTDGMDQIFNSYEKITEEFYDELEETMIMGDIGVKTTEELLDHLREEVRAERIRYAADCRQELILGIRNRMKQGPNAYDFEKGPAVILVIGVNGVEKRLEETWSDFEKERFNDAARVLRESISTIL